MRRQCQIIDLEGFETLLDGCATDGDENAWGNVGSNWLRDADRTISAGLGMEPKAEDVEVFSLSREELLGSGDVLERV